MNTKLCCLVENSLIWDSEKGNLGELNSSVAMKS